MSYFGDDWQYENSGTADSLIVSGTTLKNLNATKSRTGVAFYQTTRAKCFDIPVTNEIWIKFDVYFNGTTRWRAYNGGANGTTGITAQTSGDLSFFANSSNVQQPTSICKKNQLQTVLLHMVSGTSYGVVEAWVDGNFIYRYSGDVNHGEDFADIYLQSDGSGTFFSNVVIANFVTYGLAVKPEVYISWIPTGKISVNPKIYISYIPLLEKATADTFRKATARESNSVDTFRQVTQDEKIVTDTFRKVVRAEKNPADLGRKLFTDEKISGDIFRQVVDVAKVEADIYREVKKIERFIGDTSRKIGLTTISGDTWRNLKVNESVNFDICRRVANEEEVSADLYLKVARGEIAKADIYRKVTNSVTTVADTERKVGIREKISADTKLVVCTSEKVVSDTFLKITATERTIADLHRGLREIVSFDTFRKVTRKEKSIASTVIRLPHVLNYVQQNRLQTLNTSEKTRFLSDNPVSILNTFKDYGVTSFDVTLSERTLSDDFRIDVIKDMEIEDIVQGKLFDYPFNFLVEEIDQTNSVTSVNGKYSKDEQLYTLIALSCFRANSESQDGSSDEIVYLKASEIISKAASYLGLGVDIKIDDFTPYNLGGDYKITYADLLSTLFSWTSKLPQRQINVFIRDGVLYCVQRGKEDSVFDITDLPHSRPDVNKKLIRTMWCAPKGIDEEKSTSGVSGDDDIDDTVRGILDYQVEDIPQPFSGTISFSDVDDTDSTGCSTELGFSNGLLMFEHNTTWSMKRSTSSSVSYSYQEIFPVGTTELNIVMRQFTGLKGDWYLVSKKTTVDTELEEVDAESGEREIKKSSQSGRTNYFYTHTAGGDLYLQLERESSTTTTTTITFDKNGVRVGEPEKETKSDSRETYHVPLGNGWYGQSVYQNGLAQGSSISQGVPGNKVTQYTVIEVQKTFSNTRYTITYNNPDSGSSEEPDGTSERADETYEDLRRQLAPIADTSFPVREFDLLRKLTEALLWLNRKIQKTVTVDLVATILNGVSDINHIVDFTERVKMDGEEYFLISNKISFTPRKLIQKLRLIRWY